MTEKTEALIIASFITLLLSIGAGVIAFIGYKILVMP
jgi:hypothetical protein